MREDYAIILDFLPTGYSTSRYPMPIAQAIGERNYSLFELVPKEGVTLKPEEKVYIGSGERDKIRLIKRRLKLKELTSMAREVLDTVLEKLIKQNEEYIINFLNNAGMITPRLHKLELLPGIGKKHALNIIKTRPFSSYEDFIKRTGINDIQKIIKKRILMELEGNEKYYLFTRPFIDKRF
jgi:putative nucleotide binding protein